MTDFAHVATLPKGSIASIIRREIRATKTDPITVRLCVILGVFAMAIVSVVACGLRGVNIV